MPDKTTQELGKGALGKIFLDARTHRAWRAEPVSDEILVRLVDVLKLAPTTLNSSPGRFLFLRSPASKERLKTHLSSGNIAHTMAAPVTAIIAHDLAFYEQLPKLSPGRSIDSWRNAGAERIMETAFRNGSLQGAYLIIAARALGLDCGPMSGFDNAGVDAEFFAGTPLRSNFLCNLGHADPSGLRPRAPRLTFDEMARII